MAKPFTDCTDVERTCKLRKSTESIVSVVFEPYTKTQTVKTYKKQRAKGNGHDYIMTELTLLQMATDEYNWVEFGELPDEVRS